MDPFKFEGHQANVYKISIPFPPNNSEKEIYSNSLNSLHKTYLAPTYNPLENVRAISHLIQKITSKMYIMTKFLYIIVK